MGDLLFTDTITLYNYYNGAWYCSVLEGVQWQDKATKTVDSNGKMHITLEVNITVPYRGGYAPPNKYAGDGFTFGLDDLDVIVLGECDKEITDSYTITQLLKDESKAATIYAAEDNTLRSLLKHWRVYAK